MNTDNHNGWQLATNSALLLQTFGTYPSFHDAFVRTFRMTRARQHPESQQRQAAPDTVNAEHEQLDLELEILHNRYGPERDDARPDFVVWLRLVDIRSAKIDVNAMIEGSWIMDLSLSRAPDGVIRFDLLPNIGLDIELTCREAVVCAVRPYLRSEL